MRPILISCLCLLVLSCASSGGRNPSTYQAVLDEQLLDREQFSTFVIASINLGKPSRTYLQKHEDKIDNEVRKYLRKHGYEFVDSSIFDQAYRAGVRRFGDPYDVTTGRLNERSFVAALQETARTLSESSEIDGIIFTDLIESQVFFTSGINRVARFHGVTRKPSMQGPGQGVPSDFNWVQEIDAVSLFINIYNLNLDRLFHNAGGIELTEAVDTHGTPRFARRRNVLKSNGQIREGIELAFHPLIEMENWPGPK